MPSQPKPAAEHFAVLGLEPGATVAEARLAYPRRARLLHPDQHPDATDEERARLGQAMAALNVAWEAIERDKGVPAASTSPPADLRIEVPGFEQDWRWQFGVGLRLLGGPDALAGLRGAAGVVSLDLHDRPVGDEHLRLLGDLPELRRLDLAQTVVTDRGLDVIARRYPTIRDLDLSATAITDAGLVPLAALPSLHSLTLVDSAVTDDGLSTLGGIAGLEILNLRGTAVGGRGLHHLAGLPRLRLLSLPRIDRGHRAGFAAARRDVELL